MNASDRRRLMRKYGDNDGAEENEVQETAQSRGNTRLPFGLCQKYGIALPKDATPRDAWDALAGRGITPQQVFDNLQQKKAQSQNPSAHNYATNQSGAKGISPQNQGGEINSCKTFDDLCDFFQRDHGVSIDKSVRSLDFPSVHEASKGIDIMLREFPRAKGVLTELTTGGSGYMCATALGQIKFNPFYFQNGQANIKKRMELDSQFGGSPKNCSTKECGAHETGHILELALICRKYENNLQRNVAWNECWLAKEIVQPARLEVKKRTKQRVDEISAEVSRYACKNFSECLAECVADYVANGENASELAKEVWKKLKKELG